MTKILLTRVRPESLPTPSTAFTTSIPSTTLPNTAKEIGTKTLLVLTEIVIKYFETTKESSYQHAFHQAIGMEQCRGKIDFHWFQVQPSTKQENSI